jgi:hypothetical protein
MGRPNMLNHDHAASKMRWKCFPLQVLCTNKFVLYERIAEAWTPGAVYLYASDEHGSLMRPQRCLSTVTATMKKSEVGGQRLSSIRLSVV